MKVWIVVKITNMVDGSTCVDTAGCWDTKERAVMSRDIRNAKAERENRNRPDWEKFEVRGPHEVES